MIALRLENTNADIGKSRGSSNGRCIYKTERILPRK